MMIDVYRNSWEESIMGIRNIVQPGIHMNLSYWLRVCRREAVALEKDLVWRLAQQYHIIL